MRLKWLRAVILTGVFFLAIVVFAYITNRGNTDLTADMGGATLPVISFGIEGYEANSLEGYTNEMEIAAMRDTITPANALGDITLHIHSYGNKITSLSYEVFSLDGETSLQKEKIKHPEKSISFLLGGALVPGTEGVMKVTLHTDKGKDIYYYTRVIKSDELFLNQCINFANDFHTKTFDKAQAEILSGALEPDVGGENDSFQEVTIHSDVEHVTWGKLHPTIGKEMRWSIKESNASYTSLLLNYQVTCPKEGSEPELYNVKEFFRVRYEEGTTYLLDYNRTMNQVFKGTTESLNEKGITLGIAPLDLPYITNKNGTIVSFVQERELWNYDQDNDALSLVFSFMDAEGIDARNQNDTHEIHLITMDDNGSTTFVVYGYMNRGKHEGEVGAAVYYYDINKNAVEEKVFIPSTKSFGITQDELGRLVYYNHQKEILYIMTAGTLHKVDMKEEKQEEIVKDLKTGQYVSSDDGHLVAYQMNGELQTATKVSVLNLATGKNHEIEAGKDESIKPLGFVKGDFVYGVSRVEDTGTTVAGQAVLPMYKVEICDGNGKVAKSYSMEQIYILDVFIEGNMITLNRTTKNGTVYTVIPQDYITNNEEKAESNIMLEVLNTDVKESQMRFTFSEGIQDEHPKILKPKQVLFENPTTISFENKDTLTKYYVYGTGKLIGTYDKAGYAIQKANECSGVVISSSQSYVWERGNRELTYELENMEPVRAAEGEGTLSACLRQIIKLEGQEVDVNAELAGGKSPLDVLTEYIQGTAMDLTGCTTEEMLYLIGKGTPVIAMTDSANAVLLTGYGKINVQFMNPATGTVELQPMDIMDEMVAGSGNTFIGYVK